MGYTPEYRALLAVDIEQSAGRGDVALHQIRDTLAETLRQAFRQSGMDWDTCPREDLGDGFRITAPAGVPKTRLIHPLVHEIAVRLWAHNRLAGPATRVRVRIALHAGDVYIHPTGLVTGRPLEVLARMLDAAALRTALAQAPENVTTALLVSQHIFDETVRHGYPGIDPAAFQKVSVVEKELTADAWLHLPGLTNASRVPTAPCGRVGASTPSHPKMVNRASGNSTLTALQHGTQNINLGGRN